MDSDRHLLAVIELGGYPDFTPLYQEAGYTVAKAHSVRKATPLLKQLKPEVVVAEFIYAPMYGTRISNLESLVAGIQRYSPGARLIVFYDKSDEVRLQRLRESVELPVCLSFPIDEQELKQTLP